MKPKPCPFCGKDAKIKTLAMNTKEIIYSVECDNQYCPAHPCVENVSKKEAIKGWNAKR